MLLKWQGWCKGDAGMLAGWHRGRAAGKWSGKPCMEGEGVLGRENQSRKVIM